ncbi:MAG TPA: AsmA family protein [Acidobacteriaceae bacterium]|nr:AsmA family protein [Acidobacteriaceae bacterium]
MMRYNLRSPAMQATSSPPHSDAETPPPEHGPSRHRTRLAGLFVLLLILVSIAVLPPLVNVSRFQKRIARNISAALGRPVYFDSVTLVLFPRPGFTLTNVVIDEDPAFGYEPLLRAEQVEVTLRLSSLFHSHTEFSKIAFSDPSVNLVYSNGRWNIESLLLQAAHTQAAPTAQPYAGPARRFPYIEATGARLNLKLDQEKSPVSFTDSEFALWLPEPHQWHVRLKAHPARTDFAPGETGILRAEGILGSAAGDPASLADVPLELHGDWRDAQLGGLSGLLLGKDPGLRGDFALAFTLHGTVGRSEIAADLKLANARRADFVPDHPLSLEASCTASSADTFRAFPSIACHWPPPGSSDPALLAVAASLPDARNLESASGSINLPALPADTFFDWLSIATPHPPAVVAGAGSLSGSLMWGTSTAAAASSGVGGSSPGSSSTLAHRSRAESASATQTALSAATLTGQIAFTGGSLQLDPSAGRTLALGDVILTSTQPVAPAPSRLRKGRAAAPAPAADTFLLKPLQLDLGGRQPATLAARFDGNGYTVHLTGSALPTTLRQLAKAVPQLGDNLAPVLDQLDPPSPPDAGESSAAIRETPIPIDLTATRTWGGPQTWSDTSSHR